MSYPPPARSRRLLAYALFCALLPGTSNLHAQDRTVLFDTDAPGDTKTIPTWGLDVTWPSYDNVRRGSIFMGEENVDLVRVGFVTDEPLQDGDLTPSQKGFLDTMANLADVASPGIPLTMSSATGEGVDPWYQSGDEIIPERWVEAMEAAVRHYDRPIVSTEPFNEPDFGWGQGTAANLNDICALLQASPVFEGIMVSGPSTLSASPASWWYNQIKDNIDEGTTHALDGTFDEYINFYLEVTDHGHERSNPEVHNLVEVLSGAEYGMDTAIWWGTAELARGEFVRASQGERLGYAEHRPNWSAAAVYRGPRGAVQAFLGGSERMGVDTTYRFVARDRNVFFNGDGPRREFTVNIPGDQEKVIGITWGDDVPHTIDGRYVVVNRDTKAVMEVANGSDNNGADIRVAPYTGASHQYWDVTPFSHAWGDQSYHEITAVHSDKSADVYNFSYEPGGNIAQWDNLEGPNQHWFFEYLEDGWFHIRSRWSGLYLEADRSGQSANVRQWSKTVAGRTGSSHPRQQWRLIPAGAAVEFDAPETPAGLQADANEVSVALSWEAGSEADLAGYTVLRSDTAGGPYEIIARDLTDTNFIDNSANRNRPYYYTVRARDESRNRSEPSVEADATPGANPTLVAHYVFEGDLHDGSGNANHAGITGAETYGDGTVGDLALVLDGSSHLSLPPEVAHFDEITLAGWVYWNGGDNWQRIFDFGNGEDQNLFLTPQASGAGLRFAITDGGSEQQLNAPALPAGQWVHIAVTLGDSIARLYVDGANVAESDSITIRPTDFRPVLNYLGKSQHAADPLFDGTIDDFRIYNYALSDSLVNALAGSLTPAQAWRMEHFGNTDDTGDASDFADPDGDGVTNLLERAFGGDPNVPDATVLPVVDDNSPRLSIIYRRSLDAPDLTYTVLESTELSGDWSPAEGGSEVIEQDGPVQHVRFTRNADSEERLFLRLRVTRK